MAIDKKLIHFKSKSVFNQKLANNEILDTSIVFIKDTQEIWTHGQLYKCTDNDTTYSAGDGISLSGTTFSHADTNTNISTDTSYGPTADVTQSAKNTATFKIPQITLDQFGHVKSVSEKTITVTDTDTNTNTHYTTGIRAGKSQTITNTSVNDPYIKIVDDATYREQIQLKGEGTVSIQSDASGVIRITGSAHPTTLKNPNSLKFGTKSYDGSSEQEITAADLGLSSALKYCGITTTALSDGSTTNPITINDSDHTAEAGCVVFYEDKEFAFNGSSWEELGYSIDLSGYKTKQTAKNSPAALTTTATAFIDTISQDANGVITATKRKLPIASSTVAGITKVIDSNRDTSTDAAASAGAVKATWDLASSKWTYDENTIKNVISNTPIYETQIQRGQNTIGDVTVVDMAMSNKHNPNRLAYGNPDGVKIEYSRDGGSTWTDYGATWQQKVALYSGQTNAFYAGNRTSNTSLQDRLRITLNAKVMGVYTNPKKLLLNVSMNGTTGATMTIERARLGSNTSFEYYNEYFVNGWSGWNSIPLDWGTFGGGDTQYDNWSVMRLTFTPAGYYTGYENQGAFHVFDLALHGSTDWTTPSEMARTGHIYTYDVTQSVTFPNRVTINGGLHLGSSSGDAGTDKTKIYFGDSDYAWIGEWEANEDEGDSDDHFTIHAGQEIYLDCGYEEHKGVRFSEYNMLPYSWEGSPYSYDIGSSSWRFANGYFSKQVFAAQGFMEESDERLKNFEGRINIDLDKLANLKKNYFTWKDKDDTNRQLGVSAQEIKELYPEIVTETEDGILNVAYDKLSVVALAAIDQLHDENKELKNKINTLEERLAKLESLLEK